MIRFDDLEVATDPLNGEDAKTMKTIEAAGALYGFSKALLLAYHCGRIRGRLEGAQALAEGLVTRSTP